MAQLPVEAVFFFRYTTQVFKACYARISDSQDYTKNYIQVTGDAAPELDDVLGRQGDDNVEIELVWPGGEQEAGVRPHRGETSHRVQLFWPRSGLAPTPWKLGDIDEPGVTIPGDATQVDRDSAEQQRIALENANLGPILVAVKLRGEDRRLHVRAYLERPPAGRDDLAVGVLPAQLQAAIRAMEGQCGVFRPEAGGANPPAPRAVEIVRRIRTALEHDTNVLLVGPPGTGKTVALEDLRAAEEYEAANRGLVFDPERWHDAFGTGGEVETKVVSLVFHPSYAYENFVAGLVPETDDGEMRLVARPGPLLELAHWIGISNRRATLILDEFNRGPAAAIFGDTLALLDREKRLDPETRQPGAHISRPFAGTSMLVPIEYADVDDERGVTDELRLPVGLKIVAALNSSDRSVAPLDAALRRRFAILTVAPDAAVLAQHLGIGLVSPDETFVPSVDDPLQWTAEDVKRLALHLFLTLNQRIAAVLSEDFLLGHALLWPVGDAHEDQVRVALCSSFDERIAATLRLTLLDQDDVLAAVLSAGSAETPTADPHVATWRQPPAAVAAVATPWLELHSTALMTWPAAATSLLAVLTA